MDFATGQQDSHEEKSKAQNPNTKQAPKSRSKNRPADGFGILGLGFVWSLKFGTWCFSRGDPLGLQMRLQCRRHEQPAVRLLASLQQAHEHSGQRGAAAVEDVRK